LKKRGLPKGWVYKKLGEISKIRSGGTPSRSCPEYWSNGTIPWVKIGDMSSKYVEKTQEKISHSGLDNSAAKLLEKDTLLISIFATLGEVSILKIDAACNQAIAGITVDPKLISTDYLYYYLIHIKNNIKDRGRGVAQNNINLSILNNTQIVVPPLETQQKIVAILDKAEEIKRLRAVANVQTQKLIQSVFLDMFGDPVKNPNNYKKGRIRDLTISTQYGTSKKPNDNPEHIPLIRMNNIDYWGSMNLSDIRYVDLSDEEFLKYSVRKGDLLFNRTNSRELVGKAGIYRESTSMAYAGYLIKINTENPAFSEYISGYLNSLHGKAVLFSMAKNIVGMANINAEEVKNIPILIPPIRDMEKYSELIIQIHTSEKLRHQSKDFIIQESESLMEKAFLGELVT
jgi:type I restriction enzyme S subunit